MQCQQNTWPHTVLASSLAPTVSMHIALLSHINCAICMDAVGAKELASTVCGHVFCWSCIQESLKARKKCPTCRKALRATQVHRLYV